MQPAIDRTRIAMAIPGYEILEEIERPSAFALFRAVRDTDGVRVLIKTPRRDPLRAAPVLQREFQILQSVRLPALPMVYELLHQHWALVMGDPGGRLLAGSASSRDIDLALTVGTGLAALLVQLHRHEIAHNDINPGSILFDARSKRVWLIDFALASSGLVTELRRRKPPNALAYCAPEQTGRMNRACDRRADFYSLGAVLYELLTGAPPFQSDDPLELIHWHIARVPRPPSELDPAVPAKLSEIVMKLLAKTAEDRYQSAAGLHFDLEQCAKHWQEQRDIPPFAIAQRDVSERFTIPARLYGRDAELQILLDAFDQSCRGDPRLMLVAGYSGIGKTSLIHELVKPIARERGYFVTGKFDQLSRDIPYHALIQAFRQLVQQLLAERPERLDRCRNELISTLKDNAGVIAEVIPEIELIIGKQPPPAPVAPAEAQNRFNRVFENFVAALAHPSHPLAVFLDDLQWADSATLNLLEPLLLSSSIRGLFLIGAYRDNEVGADHILQKTIAALARASAKLQTITLGPLDAGELARMAGDTLKTAASRTQPLAEVLFAKTAGNPFFVIQFMQTLYQEQLIVFDVGQSQWSCRLDAIARAAITDNVVDLMSRKINRLARSTQRAITLAACVGNRFDLETLATVSQQSPEVTLKDLSEAIAEGLILPDVDNAFVFLHDGVQHAAYAKIPVARRPQAHLAIGRLLLKKGQVTERIFDVASHLNMGARLIGSRKEILALARLNLSAGRKAKKSAAYEAALGYFDAGIGLLDEVRWRSDYELAFALNLEAAQCEYLCGQFDRAERHFNDLLERAATNLDKASVYSLRMVQRENMSRYADALASAREGLALFGFSFPDSSGGKQAALEKEINSIESLIRGRAIESLIELPVMADPEMRMVMSILTDIWSSVYILGDGLFARLISATMVRLSLVHGNSEESAYGYVTHAITAGPVREDYKSAYEFGRLALAVNERFDDKKRRAKIYQQFHAHVNFWRQPMRTCLPYAREACRSGLESGDFLYGAYGASTETWPALVANQDLGQFLRDYTPTLALMRKLKNVSFADSTRLILGWAQALRGETRTPVSFSHDGFDEDEYVERYRDNQFFTLFHAVLKLHLQYVFGEYDKALETARRVHPVSHKLIGMIWSVMFDFWNTLTLAVNYESSGEDERESWLTEMRRSQRAFAVLAENCPENFLCQSLLISAEIERIGGNALSALDLFERAVAYADETQAIQHQAMANELLAAFWLRRGNRKIAASYFRDSREHYAAWGAHAKERDLVHRHGDLIGGQTHSTEAREPDTLDAATIVKAAHAITEKIDLDDFMQQMLRIAIENAGAQRGLLLEEREGGLYVVAESELDAENAAPAETVLLTPLRASLAVVTYVARTRDTVVAADAVQDGRFAGDAYIASKRPKSILCIPILHQGKLSAILYLENNLTTGAFTSERIEVMRVLTAQAAISFENARLFDGLKKEVDERARAQEKLKDALIEVEKLKNILEAENVYLRGDLIANVSHDLRTPLASLRGYLETLLMKEDSLTPDERRRYLRIAARQSEHLALLVGELFELAKLDFKGFEVNPEPVKLDELARDVAQKFSLTAEKKGISLKTVIGPRIPFISANIGLIERAFENLFENALNHAKSAVTAEISFADDTVNVKISDDGVGIAKDDLPLIFERFYRAEKSRNSPGAGLGLAITKRIVELHGGEIAVQSSPGEGTSFGFSLKTQ